MKTGGKPGTSPVLGHLDRRIIATVREPFIVLNGDLRVISVNASFCRTFKVPSGETEGRLIYELGNHQWDIPQLRELLTNLLTADQEFQDFEVEHDFPNIGQRTMLLNARHLSRGKDETNNLILLAIEDVTERKRAEEALQRLNTKLEKWITERTEDLHRTVEQLRLEIQDRLESEAKLQASKARLRSSFDQSPVGMVIADLDFRFKQVNPAFCRIIGYTEKELYSMAVTDIVHPDDLAKGLAEMRRFLTGEIDNVRLEERNIRKDGAVIWVETSSNMIRDSEARPLYYLGIIQDVTARKQAEEALRESEQRLRYVTSQILTSQEQERQRIARDLHDEMGQSLMALKMQLNAFKRRVKRGDEGWEEFDQALDFVNVIAEHIRETCQSLLPTSLESLGLNGALREMLSEFQKYHGLEVMDEIADLSGLFPDVVQIMIYRFFQECLTNALRHGKATSVKVRANKEDDTVLFSCEDNGVGFDLQEVKSRKRPGMGLVTMEERVRLLRGSFEITSSKGQGTRIEIILPADKA